MSTVNKCPQCNFTSDTGFKDCPKCGVIVSKFLEREKELKHLEERESPNENS